VAEHVPEQVIEAIHADHDATNPAPYCILCHREDWFVSKAQMDELVQAAQGALLHAIPSGASQAFYLRKALEPFEREPE
jgi:hypothetical protein